MTRSLKFGDVIDALLPSQNPQGREQEGLRPAIEFQAIIHGGNIQIPEIYQSGLEGAIVKIILLTPSSLRDLFKATQFFPQVQSIIEESITSEIEDYRFEN